MAYGDDWEREYIERWQRWAYVRWLREIREEEMHPDERLDEVGWDIFHCAIARNMDPRRAADSAMGGTYRERRRVRDDMLKRLAVVTKRRYAELNPQQVTLDVWETQAPDQLAFWENRLTRPSYVYFIQSGEHGAVKIGLSLKPQRRVHELQTGNPDDLLLRHVIPGDRSTELALHRRFEPARIRGRREWFGLEYLPVILAFAGGLADEMLHAYDGSGCAPRLTRATVRSEREIERIRRDIERLWLTGFGMAGIAQYTGLDEEEVEDHLAKMSRSPIYDLDVYRRYRKWRRERYRRAS